MKAMILAAGRGKRMRHLTDTTAKPLLKLWGKSLIEWQILSLKKAGFTDIVINTAHFSKQFEPQLGDGSRYGVSISYSVEGEDYSTSLETKGGIVNALNLLKDGNDPFAVVSGDIVTDFDYSTLGAAAQKLKSEKLAAHLVLVPNPSFKSTGDMTVKEGKIFREPKDYTYGNIAVFSPSIFEGESSEFAPLFPWLYNFVDKGLVSGELFTGKWANVGTPEDLEFYETQKCFFDR